MTILQFPPADLQHHVCPPVFREGEALSCWAEVPVTSSCVQGSSTGYTCHGSITNHTPAEKRLVRQLLFAETAYGCGVLAHWAQATPRSSFTRNQGRVQSLVCKVDPGRGVRFVVLGRNTSNSVYHSHLSAWQPCLVFLGMQPSTTAYLIS